MVMSPDRLGTTNNCAGEGQKQYTGPIDRCRPHFKTGISPRKNKNIVIFSMGLEESRITLLERAGKPYTRPIDRGSFQEKYKS
jgi:hypothetical protein